MFILGSEDTTGVNQTTCPDFAGAGHMRRADTSRRHRRVIEPTTVRLPAIRTDTHAGAAPGRDRFRRTPLPPRMGAVTVVVTPELEELHLQIGGGPEKGAVQAFPSNRANESFNE